MGVIIIRTYITRNVNIRKTVACLILASIANYFLAISGVSYFVVLLIDALFVILANIKVNIPKSLCKILVPGATLLLSLMCFAMGQNELYTDMTSIPINGIFLNIAICLCFILMCIYLLGRVTAGITVGAVLLMVFASIDYLVYSFRGTEFSPYDLMSLGTAMNVAGEYEFPVSSNFFISWAVIALLLVLVSDFTFEKVNRKEEWKRYAISFVVLIVAIMHLSGTVVSYRWGNGGAIYRGVFANFLLELQESRVKKPDGYKVAELTEVTDKYNAMSSVPEDMPNVIVIMNESYADLQSLGKGFDTNEPVMPYFNKLTDNTIRGYAYSSVYGGGTSSAEFEFLTGNSMAFLPSGSIPYQQFVESDSYSMVSVFKNLGYKCEAFHPYYADGWNRQNVYPMLGFDETFYLESFPQEDLIRGLVSDTEMYKTMLSKFRETPKEQPIFMFGVTMQNHGGYTDETYNNYITINGHEGEYPEAEQYLSLIKQSDSAFKYLIKQLKKTSRPTIVVFFGDHLPSLPTEFYELFMGEVPTGDSTNYYFEHRKVPFIIWANYDIEPDNVERTSLNYLSSYVYKIMGLQTPYNALLSDIAASVPVLNANGYYSIEESTFKQISDAEGDEKDALELYRKIQYNNLFDRKHRLSIFN